MTVHTRNETDMRSFEDALHNPVCHIFAYRGGVSAPRSICGAILREEQQIHGRHVPLGGFAELEFCDGCGARRCASCRELSRR